MPVCTVCFFQQPMMTPSHPASANERHWQIKQPNFHGYMNWMDSCNLLTLGTVCDEEMLGIFCSKDKNFFSQASFNPCRAWVIISCTCSFVNIGCCPRLLTQTGEDLDNGLHWAFLLTLIVPQCLPCFPLPACLCTEWEPSWMLCASLLAWSLLSWKKKACQNNSSGWHMESISLNNFSLQNC